MKFSRGTLAAVLLALSSGAGAAQFHTLSLPSWVDFWPGPNQVAEFGGGDDVLWDDALQGHPSNLVPGPLNPNGWTGSYHFTDPNVFPATGLGLGYFSGSLTLAGPAVMGANTIAAVETTFDQSLFDPYGNGADIDEPGNPTTPLTVNSGPFATELIDSLPATLTFLPGNTYQSDYFYRQLNPVAGFHAILSGLYLRPGDDADALGFDPILVDLANFAIDALNGDPATQGWTMLVMELGTFGFADQVTGDPLPGLNAVSGVVSQIAYSLDPGAVPIPLPAGLPLLLAGIAALGLTRRRRYSESRRSR